MCATHWSELALETPLAECGTAAGHMAAPSRTEDSIKEASRAVGPGICMAWDERDPFLLCCNLMCIPCKNGCI